MGTISILEEIKHCSIRDLAGIYGVCDKTLKRWIAPFTEEIGAKNGRYYSVAQVKIILEKLGMPCKVVN